jgi:hypothetical protein
MKSSAWSSLTFLLAASLLFTLCSAAGETERHEHHERRELHARASANLKNTSDKVHGIIMSVTVVLIFPLGAMSGKLLNRVFSPRSLLWIHVGCQVLGLTLLVTGFGVGVWVAILHTEVCLLFYPSCFMCIDGLEMGLDLSVALFLPVV